MPQMTLSTPQSIDPVPASFNFASYVTAPHATRAAEHIALTMITGADIEQWTWAQIWARMCAWQDVLQNYDLRPGSRIVLALPNCPDIPALMLAAGALGLVPVVLSSQLREETLRDISRDCGAALRIDGTPHDAPQPHAAAFGGEGAAILRLADVETQLSNAEYNNKIPKYIESLANNPAYMVYTSGTTGAPRGVVHAHRAVWARRRMFDGWTGITAQDTVLHSGQLNWTYAMGIAIFDAWAVGARSIIYEGPRSAATWARLIREHSATIFAAVPSLYRQLCRDIPTLKEDTKSLRHALCAGEPLPIPLWKQWRAITHKPLYEALGMSECSTYISSGPDTPTRPGSPGRPQKGRRVAILPHPSKDTTPLPPNTVGMLAIHQSEPGLMLGYYDNPDANKKAMRGDWFLTGDLAALDESGYLQYHGRSDDTIISLGYRVGPAEVEAALIQHPDIREVAVAPYSPREDLTLVCAHLILEAHTAWSPALEADIRAFAQQHLAEYKQPKVYAVHMDFPRNRSGKVVRKKLRYADAIHRSASRS